MIAYQTVTPKDTKLYSKVFNDKTMADAFYAQKSDEDKVTVALSYYDEVNKQYQVYYAEVIN